MSHSSLSLCAVRPVDFLPKNTSRFFFSSQCRPNLWERGQFPKFGAMFFLPSRRRIVLVVLLSLADLLCRPVAERTNLLKRRGRPHSDSIEDSSATAEQLPSTDHIQAGTFLKKKREGTFQKKTAFLQREGRARLAGRKSFTSKTSRGSAIRGEEGGGGGSSAVQVGAANAAAEVGAANAAADGNKNTYTTDAAKAPDKEDKSDKNTKTDKDKDPSKSDKTLSKKEKHILEATNRGIGEDVKPGAFYILFMPPKRNLTQHGGGDGGGGGDGDSGAWRAIPPTSRIAVALFVLVVFGIRRPVGVGGI